MREVYGDREPLIATQRIEVGFEQRVGRHAIRFDEHVSGLQERTNRRISGLDEVVARRPVDPLDIERDWQRDTPRSHRSVVVAVWVMQAVAKSRERPVERVGVGRVAKYGAQHGKTGLPGAPEVLCPCAFAEDVTLDDRRCERVEECESRGLVEMGRGRR